MQRQRETYPVNHSGCSGMNVCLAGVGSCKVGQISVKKRSD